MNAKWFLKFTFNYCLQLRIAKYVFSIPSNILSSSHHFLVNFRYQKLSLDEFNTLIPVWHVTPRKGTGPHSPSAPCVSWVPLFPWYTGAGRRKMDKAKCFDFPGTPDGRRGQTWPWLTGAPATVAHCIVPRKERDFSAVLQLLPATLHSTFHRAPLTPLDLCLSVVILERRWQLLSVH